MATSLSWGQLATETILQHFSGKRFNKFSFRVTKTFSSGTDAAAAGVAAAAGAAAAASAFAGITVFTMVSSEAGAETSGAAAGPAAAAAAAAAASVPEYKVVVTLNENFAQPFP